MLFGRKLKNKIRRKSLLVAFDLLVQASNLYTIQLREICVENYAPAAEKQNSRLDDECRSTARFWKTYNL